MAQQTLPRRRRKWLAVGVGQGEIPQNDQMPTPVEIADERLDGGGIQQGIVDTHQHRVLLALARLQLLLPKDGMIVVMLNGPGMKGRPRRIPAALYPSRPR